MYRMYLTGDLMSNPKKYASKDENVQQRTFIAPMITKDVSYVLAILTDEISGHSYALYIEKGKPVIVKCS